MSVILKEQSSLRLNSSLVESELNEKNPLQRFEIKKFEWHGLSHDQPLVFSEIINSCFRNSARKKFPNYLMDIAEWEDFNHFSEHKTAEQIIDIIRPKLAHEFDSKKIHLHNLEHLR